MGYNFLSLPGQLVHFIGIKGSGMTAMVEILKARGACISGSDVAEKFYTDEILASLGVTPQEGFAPDHIPEDTALVIRSAAYGEDHEEVAEALKRGLPVLTYPQALGELSQLSQGAAIAGVHGKTTTAILAGTLARELGLPATVAAGSAAASLGNRSTWSGGERFFIAETCEYRRHFLHFHPRYILLTSLEWDHQDFFPDYPSIRDAFTAFTALLPPGGRLLYCHDDPGAREVAEITQKRQPEVVVLPYGESASGPWQIRFGEDSPGRNVFSLQEFPQEFSLQVPGRHIALDAGGALALTVLLSRDAGFPGGADPRIMARALASYTGSRRRSEIIGEARGVLVMDDYAHHPTAIRAALEGLKKFYPQRRLVVDFMSHTYTRTAALLEEFSQAFGHADILILHDIFASAREVYDGSLSGEDLYKKTADQRDLPTLYYESKEDALPWLKEELKPGDLFLTMGAGNNDSLGRFLFDFLREKDKE